MFHYTYNKETERISRVSRIPTIINTNTVLKPDYTVNLLSSSNTPTPLTIGGLITMVDEYSPLIDIYLLDVAATALGVAVIDNYRAALIFTREDLFIQRTSIKISCNNPIDFTNPAAVEGISKTIANELLIRTNTLVGDMLVHNTFNIRDIFNQLISEYQDTAEILGALTSSYMLSMEIPVISIAN